MDDYFNENAANYNLGHEEDTVRGSGSHDSSVDSNSYDSYLYDSNFILHSDEQTDTTMSHHENPLGHRSLIEHLNIIICDYIPGAELESKTEIFIKALLYTIRFNLEDVLNVAFRNLSYTSEEIQDVMTSNYDFIYENIESRIVCLLTPMNGIEITDLVSSNALEEGDLSYEREFHVRGNRFDDLSLLVPSRFIRPGWLIFRNLRFPQSEETEYNILICAFLTQISPHKHRQYSLA